MITQKELLSVAQGAAASATGYVMECLEIDVEAPIPDLAHQALVLTSALTLVLLEVQLKAMIPNPAARDRIRDTVEQMSRQIAEKIVDKDLPRLWSPPNA